MAKFFRQTEETLEENNPLVACKQSFDDILKKIYEQREEILTAFVAKYNCQPDECVQVVQHVHDGEKYWIELKISSKKPSN